MSSAMNRRRFLGTGAAAMAGFAMTRSLAPAKPPAGARPMNILFLGADDLRVELGCYGATHMRTPHIDALAARGVVFSRAYVQQAVCAASRASFLTGCRPDTTNVDYPYNPGFLKDFLPAHPALHTIFHQAGYYTRCFGKIHHSHAADLDNLSEPDYVGEKGTGNYALPSSVGKAKKAKNQFGSGPATEMADVDDTAYKDGQIAREVVATLERAAKQDKPFFLSVGFYKPHLPFCAPQKYWDLYKREDIHLSPNPEVPKGAPAYAPATYELPTYPEKWGTKEHPIGEAEARLLRHGYFACVSYIDAQIGLILDALRRLGLEQNTLIMLWGDHGWHLGDNGCWGKHTNYERATRSPLIVVGPNVAAAGQRCDALVEYVDMFPTLLEMSGIAIPAYCEGLSLRPLLTHPGLAWKTAAFSQYPRGKTGELEGYSIRTDRWRYVEWRRKPTGADGKIVAGGTPKIEARELYDHQADPNESVSVADAPDNAAIVAELSEKLKQGWKAALPAAARK